jgi:excisionase family DNA binding protein
MPRVTKNPVVYLALSPAAVATALGIRADEVADAINNGLLPLFMMGIKRRILVADVERWVRTWPNPKEERPHG